MAEACRLYVHPALSASPLRLLMTAMCRVSPRLSHPPFSPRTPHIATLVVAWARDQMHLPWVGLATLGRPLSLCIPNCQHLPWVGSGPRHDIAVSVYRGRDSTTCCPSFPFQVSGDGHSDQPLGFQPFSLQPPEPGCQLSLVLGPSGPRVLVSAPPPVTMSFCLYFAACHHASMSPRASACPHITVPTCPLAGALRPRYFFPFAAGDGNIPPLGNVTILYSPPEAATQRLYSSCGSLEVE
jgi:hypothetical protein